MASDRIPLVDLSARLAPMRDELLRAMERVLDSGVFVMGPEAQALEEEFASYCGVEHGVATSSGTAALHLALLALDVRPGDEVITVSNTFIGTVEAITATGATPVFVDIEPETYLMDARRLEMTITARTRAIIPVHLYGVPCDMSAIGEVAERHRLPIVEDACQAHGARYRGARAGSLGAIGCFSLYPSKNMGTVGEGGIAVTRDAALAARMRRLRSHGESARYQHDEPGLNLRMPELMAAVARPQLRQLDEWNARRRDNARSYERLAHHLAVQLPIVPDEREPVYHLYVIGVEHRDAVRAELELAGVATGVHYPVPVHLQPAYRGLPVPLDGLRNTENAASRILSLPMYPELTERQVAYVVDALASATASAAEAVCAPT